MDLTLAFDGNRLEFYNPDTGEAVRVSMLDALLGFLKHTDTDRKSALLRDWVKRQKSYLAEIERLINEHC